MPDRPPSGRVGVIPREWSAQVRNGMSPNDVLQTLGPPLLRLGADRRKPPPDFAAATGRHDWKWPGGAGLQEAWFYAMDRRGQFPLRHRTDLLIEFGPDGVRWTLIQEIEGEPAGIPADAALPEGTIEGVASAPSRARKPATPSPAEPLSIDNIRVTKGPARPVPASEVDEAETWLGGPFPDGYREFVTRLGGGTLAGFVRVYTPSLLRHGDASLADWQQRITQFWVWDNDPLLTPARGVECVRIADTLNGDEFVFHPSDPDRLLVLARGDSHIHDAGSGLLAAFDWALRSGKLTGKLKSRSFEPFD